MNFQTSKRIMCCLMAALILCCAVVRPLEASASALATGAVVGFALEPAISAILVALGVTGTVAAFSELTKTIAKTVPSEYIIKGLDGTEYLSAINYNDMTYVSQELAEWVLQALRGFKTEVEPVYGLDFVGVTKLTNVGSLYEDVMSAVNTSTSKAFYNKWRPLIAEAKKCYSIAFTGSSSYGGLYYWGNTLPEFKTFTNASFGGITYSHLLQVTVPNGGIIASQSDTGEFTLYAGGTVTFPNVSGYTINSGYGTPATVSLTESISNTNQFHTTVPDYETWVFPGIHIIILPEDDPPPETEPEETEPPESEPPESQPAVTPTPSEPDPDVTEPEPEVTDPVEIPDTTVPSETEPETPEETEPVENPYTYETYIPITFPNTILDPNEVTQPEVQTGNGSTQPEIETGNEVEIEDPNQTEEPTNPDDDTELGDPVVWPDFPSVDTPDVPFPGTDNDYTGAEEDTSWLTKIGEWIKWLGELIKEWIKWLGEYIVEWIKWLGEIVQLLPDAIAYYLKLMVQWLVEAFKPLFQKLAEWLQPLMDYLLEGLKKLFVPKDGYFDEKIEILKAKFPLLNSVLTLADLLKAFFLGLGATPPIIYIDLGAGSGWHYMGGRTIFVDFSWYAQYKPTMDAILSAFLWLWFAWRLLLRMPGIIQGASAIEGTRESVYMLQEREKR